MKITKNLAEKIEKLKKLLDKNNCEIVSSRCSGKYRGCIDYSLVFDENNRLWVGNSIKCIEKNVDELIEKYENFNINKNSLLEKIREIKINDDEVAELLNLQKYEILDLYIETNNKSYFGWFVTKLKLEDGTIINHIETGLNYEIENNNLTERKRYFVAGGVKNPVFVFNKVGYDKDLYKVR